MRPSSLPSQTTPYYYFTSITYYESLEDAIMKAVKANNNRRISSSSRAAGLPSNASAAAAANKHPPVSPPTTVELRGVPIHFPFQPYDCQKDYMEKVLDALFRSENALLESPTGTGKTLCLLCATLAWQRDQARQLYATNPPPDNTTTTTTTNPRSSRRVPTIIYASRTHSQLSQVVRELRTTRYRPRHAVLGSREQMCVHPKVKRTATTASDINHDCSRLAQERKCAFRNKLEGFAPPPTEPSQPLGTQSVMDMEDLVAMGHKHRVCPFYYTRNLVEDAELILVPYNYLFDKDSRTSTLADVPWKNAVVIFDEAHNLESFASESASFDLSTTDIAGCLNEIQRAVNYVQTFGGGTDEGGGKLRPENIAKLKTIFLKLEEYIMNTLSAQTMAYRGEFMMELFQKGAGINHANHQLFIQEVRKLTDVFLQFGASSSSGNNNGKGGGGSARLEHFIQCVKRVFGEPSEARCFAKAQSYRVHITQKQSQSTPSSGSNNNNNNDRVTGRTVSYWCFAPSEAMRELANLEVRSFLVTSGTLSPLESYALELDLPFPHRLENPHIIPDDQIHVRIIGKGVSNKILSSAYERRQDDEYYTELGNTLVSLAKIIPGGMLIFFPSYGVMETCLERWGGPASSSSSSTRLPGNKTSSFFAARKRRPTGSARYSFPHAPYTYSETREALNPWKRLLGVKAVVVEPKATTDLPDAINEFHKFLNLPKSKGVALFGVCRGKISEGIDFAHDMCRAVIITGLPFAPSFDPKVKMKREFLDQNRSAQNQKASTEGGFGAVANTTRHLTLSGHEWYTQQAHRAVNQAVGRVIRNKNDYGAVLLLDNRFSLPANQQGLSKWVRPHIHPDEGMGRTIGALSRFYKDAARKSEERSKSAPIPTPPNPVSVILRYEDEGGDNNCEGKENHNNNVKDEDVEVTKIAYVDNDPTDNGKMTRTVPGDGDESEPRGTSYIRPDQIIARVDMTDGEQKLQSTKPVDKQPRATSTAAAASKPSINAKTKLDMAMQANEVQHSRSQHLTPAQKFFQLVQARMTTEEQSKMKRAAVDMKPVNGKYSPNFAKAARAMVGLILSYDDFKGKSREEKPEMINLLMQLFPKSILRDMRQLSILMIFDRSKFSQNLREKLERETYLKVRSALKSLLCNVWFEDASGGYLSVQDFLSQLEGILSTALGSLGEVESQIVVDFVDLVPAELDGVTRTFFEQLASTFRISKLKAKERASVGEASVQVARFLPPSIKNASAGAESSRPNDTITIPRDTLVKDPLQGQPSMDSATVKNNGRNPYASSAANQDQFHGDDHVHSDSGKRAAPLKTLLMTTLDRKPRPSNPYAKRSSTGSVERPIKVAKMQAPLASVGSTFSKSSSDKKPKDAIRVALDALEKDIFTGRTKAAVTTVESNAPEDWNCELCQNSCTKPFIAPCHHVACKNCWVLWFSKSETCPQCRKPATVDSLALVVFTRRPDASGSSSQL